MHSSVFCGTPNSGSGWEWRVSLTLLPVPEIIFFPIALSSLESRVCVWPYLNLWCHVWLGFVEVLLFFSKRMWRRSGFGEKGEARKEIGRCGKRGNCVWDEVYERIKSKWILIKNMIYHYTLQRKSGLGLGEPESSVLLSWVKPDNNKNR